ncbi:hypothetical protein MATL_G00092190 [Megalops atlanticus]|uniref:EF-hand domain-containing protein n=1 Tax=Megalops atlanticus TaxID=7932 RepID=A0A9D3Q970_MEGAT|nr:hypothetical protein MATL_G00092190 [Megalops atlanticus]
MCELLLQFRFSPLGAAQGFALHASTRSISVRRPVCWLATARAQRSRAHKRRPFAESCFASPSCPGITRNHHEMPSNQNLQGGKAFGLLKAQQRERLEEINKEYLEDQKYRDEEDLAEKLDSFKNKYAEFDLNDQGEIDMMGLKRMMEKLGVPKTHLEMKKMISEVTGGSSDTINYRDFVKMMLGKRSAVLKLVMMFEDKANGEAASQTDPRPSETSPAFRRQGAELGIWGPGMQGLPQCPPLQPSSVLWECK